MLLKLLDSGLRDLEAIHEYYFTISDISGQRIQSDIADAFAIIKAHPQSGMIINKDGTRRVISAQYRFVIVYDIYNDFIEVIGIYRHQNRHYS